MLNRLVALAVRTHRWSPGKLVPLIEAVNAAVLLDMEIARNIHEAATGTQQVSASIFSVNRGAQETGIAATQVMGAAGALSKRSEQLRGDVGQFIAEVKAA